MANALEIENLKIVHDNVQLFTNVQLCNVLTHYNLYKATTTELFMNINSKNRNARKIHQSFTSNLQLFRTVQTPNFFSTVFGMLVESVYSVGHLLKKKHHFIGYVTFNSTKKQMQMKISFKNDSF